MEWRDAESSFAHPVIDRTTLPRMFEDSAARNETREAQRYKGGVYNRSLVAAGVLPRAPPKEYLGITYAEMRDIVRTLAAGFRDAGVDPGARVGIFAHTRMEWAQTDLAVLAAGGVVTTVYTSSSESQVEYLLSDAGAVGVVVENEALLKRVLAVEDALDLEFVVVMDEVSGYDDREDVLTFGRLYRRGQRAYSDDAYETWLDARDLENLASLIYTSGTTGPPKGVELSHRNFRSNVNQCYRRFGPRPDREDVPTIDETTTTLSFLPLAHVFERLAGHFLMFAAGATVAYAESPDTLREDFGLVRPTVATSVPRVYEKLYDGIRTQASGSAATARVFEWATGVGRTYHESDDPGPLLSLQRRVADRLVFAKIREALGGNVDFFISGGGSLSPDLCALYHGMGVPILEGYGLTETSPVVAVNPPEEPKVGTIGLPVSDVKVRVDETVAGGSLRDSAASDSEVGELLVSGPNVARGYWNRPAETEAAFGVDGPSSEGADGEAGAGEAKSTRSDGPWLRTGDVVELRADGYVRFLERAKQLLVLSTGKNVAPGPIEDAFAANPFVEQCLVVGDGQKFVGALLVPEFERLRTWAAEDGIDLPEDARQLCRDDRVRARIRREVEAENDRFEEYERVKQFRLVPEEFTEENDLLTPTMKKKRRNILDRYADEVDLLYERTAPT